MNDAALQQVSTAVAQELQRRTEGCKLSPRERLILRDGVHMAVRIMAEWFDLDNHRPNRGPLAAATWLLKRGGEVACGPATYNDCLKWLHDNTSYSWDHALKHEGWVIVPVE